MQNNLDPVFFDFETHYGPNYTLKKMTTMEYIFDPRFEVISVSALVDDEYIVWCGDDPEWKEKFKEWAEEGRMFVAHNAIFDLRILAFKYGIKPKLVCDTMAMAKYFWYEKHTLDFLGLYEFNEGKDGEPIQGKRLSQITLPEWTKNCRYNAQDCRISKRLSFKYLPKLPPGEIELIDHTLRMCLNLVKLDTELVQKKKEELKEVMEKYEEEFPAEAKLDDCIDQLKRHIKEKFGYQLNSLDKKKLNVELPSLPKKIKDLLQKRTDYRESKKTIQDISSLFAMSAPSINFLK